MPLHRVLACHPSPGDHAATCPTCGSTTPGANRLHFTVLGVEIDPNTAIIAPGRTRA